MKKKPFLVLCILLIMVFAVGLTACTGSYAMEEFIVDFSKFKKEYEVGDVVDLSQIDISATFNDGTTEELPFNRVTFLLDGEKIKPNEPDEVAKITETAGTKTLEIKFTDIVKSVVIIVNEKHVPVLTGVEMTTNGVATEYIVKSDVSLAGLKVFAVYDNGAKKEEIALTDKNVSVFMDEENVTDNYNRITEEVGVKSIRVKYGVFTTKDSLTINVSDVLSVINVTLPDTFKNTYKVGEEVSFAGIKATATYRSGKTEDIAEIKYYIGKEEVNFDTLTATKGTKTIVAKATSGEVVGTKDIVLSVENYVDSISLITDEALLTYIVDDVITIDSFGDIKINVVYADTQDNKQISLTEDGVSCLNAAQEDLVFANLTNTAGEKVVTVSYGGKTDSFTINVTDGETALESLTVTAPTKTAYTAGEAGVTFDGLAITAAYKAEYERPNEFIQVSDFADKGVKVFFNDNQLTDYDDITKIATEGADQSFSVQVRYEGKTASFDITITNNVVSVAVDESHAKTAYKLDEKVDFSGLTVTATLNYGTKNIAVDAVTFFDGTTDITNDLDRLTQVASDSKTVTVSYGGQTDTFVIIVSDYITGISFGTTVSFATDVNKTEGSVYSFPDLEVYTDYKSGARKKVDTGYTFENNSITAPASGKTVTVIYEEFSGTVTLTVNDVLQSIVVTTIPTFAYGTDAAKTLKNITVTGTYVYKGAANIIILQEDKENFLYGVVSFAMKKGEEYETLTQLDLNEITSSSGTKELKITITENGRSVSYEFSVTVTAPAPGVSEFSLPESVVAYQTTITSSQAAQTNKTDKAFESAYFVNGTEEYLVGDDNPFKFVPRLKQVNIETGSLTELTTYQTASKVYYNGSPLTESVSGNKKTFSYEGTVMVEENFMQNTFDFTSDAIGKSFKLSVLPSRDQFDYESSEFTAVEWTVKVVDGYNLTDAKELCLLEQPGAYSTRTYWNSIKAELGLTGVRPNSIILHQNTIVTKDSIPSEFYYTLPDSYDIKYKYTDKNGVEHSCKPEEVPADYGGGNLSRTFLWDDEYALFEYDMTSGSSFTIHGNFFDIDLSRMPLVAAFEPYGVTVPSYMSGTYYGQYMSKVSFLEVRGIEGTTGAGDESFTFNNFAVKGNAAINQVLVDGSSNIKQGTDNPVFGGGLIFVKTRYCTSDIVNIHAHACFIPFYSRNQTVVNYTNAKAYDSFQNALFVNSDSVNNLNNCYFKRAGGPLMILVESSEKVNDVDVKLIPKVYANDNCELESLVTGNSQWFVTYGVTQNVAQLAALDPLLKGYFERTLLNGGQFNVIAVSIEEGGGGSAGTQAYMSYKNNAINRLDGQPSFDKTKELAGYGFGAFFLMGDAVCAPYTTDGVNYSLVNGNSYPFADCGTDMTIQTAFRNPDNQYVAIYAGGMGILAELY